MEECNQVCVGVRVGVVGRVGLRDAENVTVLGDS